MRSLCPNWMHTSIDWRRQVMMMISIAEPPVRRPYSSIIFSFLSDHLFNLAAPLPQTTLHFFKPYVSPSGNRISNRVQPISILLPSLRPGATFLEKLAIKSKWVDAKTLQLFFQVEQPNLIIWWLIHVPSCVAPTTLRIVAGAEEAVLQLSCRMKVPPPIPSIFTPKNATKWASWIRRDITNRLSFQSFLVIH